MVGSDTTGTGSIERPFGTIHRGVSAARLGPKPRTVVLRAGVHYLGSTLELTAADSGLTITAPPSGDEEVWVSGGAVLPPLDWAPVPGDPHGALVRSAASRAHVLGR